MNLLRLVLLVVFAVSFQSVLAARIPASSPTMWGLIDKYGRYYKGKVVAKEDDMTGVYFYVHLTKEEHFILNDEFFSQRVVMDINPRPGAVHVGSMALFEFSNYDNQARYISHVWETRNHIPVSGKSFHTYHVGAWKLGDEAKQKKWVRRYLTPRWVGPKQMHKMRLIDIPREYLCDDFNINCKGDKKCMLIDDLLPLAACRSSNWQPTNKPAVAATTTRSTTPTTTIRTTLAPTTSEPPPTPKPKARVRPTKKIRMKAKVITQPPAQPPTVGKIDVDEEIEEDAGDWVATVLPIIVLAGGGVFIICFITCCIRCIKGKSKQPDEDKEAQSAAKKNKKRRKRKDDPSRDKRSRKKGKEDGSKEKRKRSKETEEIVEGASSEN